MEQHSILWLIVCLSLIYTCSNIHQYGFVCIILATVLVVYFTREYDTPESFNSNLKEESDVHVSSKAAVSLEEDKKEEEEEQQDPIPKPDDRYVEHRQQTYEQRKRLYESYYKDLINFESKHSNHDCREPI